MWLRRAVGCFAVALVGCGPSPSQPRTDPIEGGFDRAVGTYELRADIPEQLLSYEGHCWFLYGLPGCRTDTIALHRIEGTVTIRGSADSARPLRTEYEFLTRTWTDRVRLARCSGLAQSCFLALPAETSWVRTDSTVYAQSFVASWWRWTTQFSIPGVRRWPDARIEFDSRWGGSHYDSSRAGVLEIRRR